MKYETIVEGRFIQRLNRFIAEVEIFGSVEKVHVKNTGRCMELFIKGALCYLEPAKNPDRKTKFSLIAIVKKGLLINIDSQIPNGVVKEALMNNKYLKEIFGEIKTLRSEVTYHSSRFDLYYENEKDKGFIEVKGVTLEQEGVCMFPDAPTLRGTKHIHELINSQKEGYKSYIFFVIQLTPVSYFTPNKERDPDLYKALLKADDQGVGVLCFDSIVTKDAIILNKPIEVIL